MLTFNQYLEEAVLKGLLSSKEILDFDKFANRRNVSQSEKEEALQLVYKFLQDDLKKAHTAFTGFVKKLIPKKLKQKTKIDIPPIKPLKSVISKVIKRKKPLSGLTDLVRGSVLFEYQEDANKFYKDLLRKHKGIVIKKEVKARGSDPKFGYHGSYHVDFMVGGVPVELQIMTRKLYAYKKEAHKFYDKYRDKPGATPDNYDRHLSKMIFSKGNTSKYKSEEVEIMESFIEDLIFEDVNINV